MTSSFPVPYRIPSRYTSPSDGVRTVVSTRISVVFRQIQHLPVKGGCLCCIVHHHSVSKSVLRLLLMPFLPPQMSQHSRLQFLQAERFYNIIISAHHQPVHTILLFDPCGQK